VAVWDSSVREFTEITSLPIHAALEKVKNLANFYSFRNLGVTVVFEDARQRTWFGRNTAAKDRARLQGAGSVKRDSTIWEDALKDWGIPYKKVAPKNNLTKLSDEAFRRLTGWAKRTNEHGRDAAMLVFMR
jgi:hypothetical protein